MYQIHGIDRRQLLLGAAMVGVGIGSTGLIGRAAHAAGRTATRHRVGGFEVVALRDATGPFFLQQELAFPGAATDDWERAQRIDPAAFGPDHSWVLDFRCYAIRRPGNRYTLVDAGVGPAESPAAAWAPVPGRLPEALHEEGIDTADVDLVVLTHLHEDHVGWSVLPDGTPLFPNARYVAQRADVEAVDAGDQSIADYMLAPLRRSGQLQVVDGDVCLGRGPHRSAITVVSTPGHTLGHQSVLVEGGRDEPVVVTGDVLVHAVQLANPDVGYAFESDQALARTTRWALLDLAVAERALLATAHLRRPFLRPATDRPSALRDGSS